MNIHEQIQKDYTKTRTDLDQWMSLDTSGLTYHPDLQWSMNLLDYFISLVITQ